MITKGNLSTGMAKTLIKSLRQPRGSRPTTQTMAPTDGLTRELENLARSSCASELLLAGEAK